MFSFLHSVGRGAVVSPAGVKNLVSWFPNLETLDLWGCSLLDDEALLVLGEGLPRLRSLHLSGKQKTAISSEGILQFAQLRGHTLTGLLLPLPPGFNLLHLHQLLLFCPDLLSAEFYFPHKLDPPLEASMDTIILPQNKIRSAKLSGLPGTDIAWFTRSAALHLRSLALHNCHGLPLTQVTSLMEECVHLELLELSLCCCIRGLAMPVAGAPMGTTRGGGVVRHVKTLLLKFCEKVDAGAQKFAGKLLNFCPLVREVELRDGLELDLPVLLFSHSLPYLQKLRVAGSTPRLYTAWPDTRTGCKYNLPRLHNVSLENCGNMSDRFLEFLAGKCPRLSDLSVSVDWKLGGDCPTFRGLSRLLHQVSPSLHRLSVVNQVGAWADNGDLLPQRTPLPLPSGAASGLQELKLVGGNCGFRETAILALVASCAQLRKLEVEAGGHCAPYIASRLTDSWLKQLVASCPQLNYLDLRRGDGRKLKPHISTATLRDISRVRPHLRMFLEMK